MDKRASPSSVPRQSTKKIVLQSPLELRNNMEKISDTKYRYEFGVRKPVQNLIELLTDQLWQNFIGKWVYSLDLDDFHTPIFYRHIVFNGRLTQIVFSGKDILGDGVYTIFSSFAYITNNEIFIEPDDFAMEKGSYECRNFLAYLTKYRYITKDDLRIFQNVSARTKFRMSIPFMERPVE